MPIQVRPDGPIPARLMIVGEAPGEQEENQGIPFVGPSGMELNRMLHEAGLSRSEVFVTNVARCRPPSNKIDWWISEKVFGKNGQLLKDSQDKIGKGIDPRKFIQHRDLLVHENIIQGIDLLNKEIAAVKPNVIVPVGNLSMWALTGKWGITKWRGSMMHPDLQGAGSTGSQLIKIIPTIHPAAVLREWSFRPAVVNDLRRARRFIDGSPYPKPKWNFHVRPSFDLCVSTLQGLLDRLNSGEYLRLSFDIETRSGHIACAGISWSLVDAICIPFLCVERASGYFTVEQEGIIVYLLYRVLTHIRARVVGQNIIYDCQYTWRHWHFVPRVVQDTMISQHTIFSSMPKALGFQASLYCNYYYYWKDEGKDWDPAVGEDQLWFYNCEDLVYTDEAGQTEQKLIDKMGLHAAHETQQALFWPVLRAMQLGILVDQRKRAELVMEVQEEIDRRQAFLRTILGHDLNVRSNGQNGQMQKLFYQDLNQPVIMTRAKNGEPPRPTLDDDALQKIAAREPLLKPIVNCIADIRTLGIFLDSFLLKPLDVDGRMRCAFNIGGSASGKSAPYTYRLSSSENAFGSGGNLQNIPGKKSKAVGKAKARGSIAGFGDPYQFPNIRRMFIPDVGYTIWDGDLDRADLQVVAWEAEDELLKAALKIGADIHLLNAFVLLGKDPPPLEELVETHPKYPDHRGPKEYVREFAKVFCHASNYGGGAVTVARGTGRTVHEIDRAQKIWFGAHPGIGCAYSNCGRCWHCRTWHHVQRKHYVENKFGYRWQIFDRLDGILPEALAWIPQSTVSVVINKIWINIHKNLPDVQVLLQVHDSLVGQFQTFRDDLKTKIKEQAKVVVPYEDPLIIPFGLKTSEVSWGDVK